jgi:hypothetical protein
MDKVAIYVFTAATMPRFQQPAKTKSGLTDQNPLHSPPGGKDFIANKREIQFDRTVTERSPPHFCLISPSNHVVFSSSPDANYRLLVGALSDEHIANSLKDASGVSSECKEKNVSRGQGLS